MAKGKVTEKGQEARGTSKGKKPERKGYKLGPGYQTTSAPDNLKRKDKRKGNVPSTSKGTGKNPLQ
ncbi:MAG: hypothetical protein MI674_00375 [Cytophagales bacterium]|nr:hypothetical protein [Cytophagales bacterium]